MEHKPFVGFVSIGISDVNDGIGWKFRIARVASTFTAEALAIGETLEITGKIDAKQNFGIFSDLEGVLKGISNTSTMNNKSHITQMLKDKTDWNRERKESNFTGSRGTVELKFMRELPQRQINQSKKV
jgi:hypothetical protein